MDDDSKQFISDEERQEIEERFGRFEEDWIFGELPDFLELDEQEEKNAGSKVRITSLPADARLGEVYNVRRAPMRKGLHRASLRRATMQLTQTPGGMRMWLCDVICPNCGEAITINVPDLVGDHHTNCKYCKRGIACRVAIGTNEPRITNIWVVS